MFDKKVIQCAFETGPEEEKLESYMNALDYNTLLKIEALMYYGRDGGKVDDKIRYLSKLKELKEIIINTILEKCPSYRAYFNEAIKKLKRSGIELDSL